MEIHTFYFYDKTGHHASGINNALIGYRVGLLEAKGVNPPSIKALEALGFSKDVAEIIIQVTKLSDAGKEKFYSILREQMKQED